MNAAHNPNINPGPEAVLGVDKLIAMGRLGVIKEAVGNVDTVSPSEQQMGLSSQQSSLGDFKGLIPNDYPAQTATNSFPW
jgi:hypothetical protein